MIGNQGLPRAKDRWMEIVGLSHDPMTLAIVEAISTS
jgi:hypothetical protein